MRHWPELMIGGGMTKRPSLLEEVAALSTKSGPFCSVKKLDDATRKEVEAVLAQKKFTYANIAKILQGRGHNVKPPALSRHDRGECGCEKQVVK